MTPLRLLAIIEADSITGPAKNLLEFARQAARENVVTTIATFVRGSGNAFTKAAEEISADTSSIELVKIPEKGPFDPGTLRSLRDIVATTQPDIVQTHAVKSHFLARMSGLGNGRPWVAFHHGYTWPNAKAKAYNQLDRWSLRAAAKVFTVSVPFREELTAIGVNPSRIEIIHNAIPANWGKGGRGQRAKVLRASVGIADDRNVVLIVGRLSREKDHLTLLEAFQNLPAEAKAHLVIVGEGPERPRIEQRARELGIVKRITMTGHQDSAAPWYGAADLAVLSSLSEGSPNALLEAMATKVPIVATAVGGIPEMVTDGESALLVQPGDVAGMSLAMKRLLLEPALAFQLQQRALELIFERHRPEARMRLLLAIYRSITNGTSKRV